MRQAAEGPDRRPLRIFAAALRGPVGGHATDAARFFGAGGRAAPAAVAADRLGRPPRGGGAPGQAGRTLFALRAPLRLAPGAVGHPPLRVRRRAAARGPAIVDPLAGGARAARGAASAAGPAGCPSSASGRAPLARARAPVGRLHRSLGRHLRGVRAQPRDLAGRLLPVRRFGSQVAFRDPLQHMLPLIYAAPALARDVLVYSAPGAAAPAAARSPTATQSLCRPADARPLRRHRPVAPVVRRRVRARHPRPGALRPSRCRFATAATAHALGSPEARRTPTRSRSAGRTAATSRRHR